LTFANSSSIISLIFGEVLNVKTKLFFKPKEFIIFLSLVLLFISTILQLEDLFKKDDDYKISYEYVNIKDMAQANVSNKKTSSKIFSNAINYQNTKGSVTEVSLPNAENVKEVSLPVLNNTPATLEEPKQIWYLPTEIGRVTQNPKYGHVALDITSPRGSGENIFPVANGVISGIYTDSAGAKIVTVLHNINNQKYTSQYVHLSAYASNIYVGKPVTINDSLGLMGTTGRSTGVHLHLAVLDCALFDPNDPNCRDLNGFFRYANTRLGQGYIGLGAMMNVPGVWYSR